MDGISQGSLSNVDWLAPGARMLQRASAKRCLPPGVSVWCLAAGLSHGQTILDHVTALQSVLYIRRNQSSYPVPVPSSAITEP